MEKRRLIFIYLLFLSGLFVQTGQALTGDVNNDNVVTILDALMTAQYSVGLPVPGYDPSVADVNGDTVINILDALIIAQYYVRLISVFPVDMVHLTGDVNRDSAVNIIDALYVAQYYIGLDISGFDGKAADVDSNEIVDIIDALLIARYFVKLITEFPARVPTPSPGPTLPPPVNLAAVRNFADLDNEDEQKLSENGFIIHGFDGTFDTLTEAYSRLMYNWDVPAFITSDSLLHVFHITFADLLIKLETYYLYPRLKTLVNDLDTAVAGEYPGLPADSLFQKAGKSLRVFTAVARALINDESVFSGAAADDIPELVNNLLDKIYACSLVENFPGGEDYTQYKVKSHYTVTKKLQLYYRTMKWLQRKRFYIVNENFPEEQDIALIASAILARIINDGSGSLPDQWEWLYNLNIRITGTIPSITPPLVNRAMMNLFGDSWGSEGYTLLSDENNRFRLRYELKSADYPEEKFVQLMGEPYLMDEKSFRSVLEPSIPGRFFPTGFDMASMLLNSLPAYNLLYGDEQTYPGYLQKLGKRTLEFTGLPESDWKSSINNYWYYTLRSLSSPVTGTVPSWMIKDTWQKEKLNSQLSSWVELHNDYINLEIASITASPTPPVTPPPTPTRTPIVTAGSAGTVWLSPVSLAVIPGSSFETGVYVNTGTHVLAAYGITVLYSSSLLSVNTSIGTSGVAAGADGFVSAVNSNNPGTLVVSGFDIAGKGPLSNLHLMNINWKAGNSTGTSNIQLMVDTLTNSDYNTIGSPNGIGAVISISSGATPTAAPTRTVTGVPTSTILPTASPTPTPTHMPGFVEPYPVFYNRLSGMCRAVVDLIDIPEITLDHKKLFNDIAGWSDKFGALALKIRNNQYLTPDEYAYIKNWGLQLIDFFGSGTISPESEARTKVIADYFTHEDKVLHIATGKLHPVIILYNVRGIGTTFAAVGYVVSYYEIMETDNKRITDEEWENMLKSRTIEHLPWRNDFWLY